MDYKVDLRDIKFQLFEWLKLNELLEAEKYADWDAENVEMVLDEGLKIAQELQYASAQHPEAMKDELSLSGTRSPSASTMTVTSWVPASDRSMAVTK